MNTDQAISLLIRAKSTLDHVAARTKTEQAAIRSVRELIEAAEREIVPPPPLPPLPVPEGARQGISSEPRAEWRGR